MDGIGTAGYVSTTMCLGRLRETGESLGEKITLGRLERKWNAIKNPTFSGHHIGVFYMSLNP